MNNLNIIILAEIQQQLNQKFANIETKIINNCTLRITNQISHHEKFITTHNATIFIFCGRPYPISFSLHDPQCVQKVIQQITDLMDPSYHK